MFLAGFLLESQLPPYSLYYLAMLQRCCSDVVELLPGAFFLGRFPERARLLVVGWTNRVVSYVVNASIFAAAFMCYLDQYSSLPRICSCTAHSVNNIQTVALFV